MAKGQRTPTTWNLRCKVCGEWEKEMKKVRKREGGNEMETMKGEDKTDG